MGDASGTPILLLHGFGGRADNWSGLQKQLSAHKSTLAYDFPGHGGSLGFSEAGEPKIAVRAIIADLAFRNIKKAHLVGFSMGGAIASLVGLFAPDVVASLTLLAPGGFGPEINHRMLQAYARAGLFSRVRSSGKRCLSRFFFSFFLSTIHDLPFVPPTVSTKRACPPFSPLPLFWNHHAQRQYKKTPPRRTRRMGDRLVFSPRTTEKSCLSPFQTRS